MLLSFAEGAILFNVFTGKNVNSVFSSTQFDTAFLFVAGSCRITRLFTGDSLEGAGRKPIGLTSTEPTARETAASGSGTIGIHRNAVLGSTRFCLTPRMNHFTEIGVIHSK